MTLRELMSEAESLPVEDRAILADALLRSLNPVEKDIDQAWAEVALRRVEEVRSGKVQTIPAEEVFRKAWGRFAS